MNPTPYDSWCTTFDFLEVLNGRRFIVRASETKISFHRWSDIAHVVSELPTARKPWYIFSPDFVQIATFLASNESARHCLFWIIYHRSFPCLSPCLCRRVLAKKNSVALINVAINFGYEYFCFVIYFSKFFLANFFFNIFFLTFFYNIFSQFFSQFFFFNFFLKIFVPNIFFQLFFEFFVLNSLPSMPPRL